MVNERIMKLFTDREVLCEVTEMVEYIFDSGTIENCPPFTTEDVEMEIEILCQECGADASSVVDYLIDADEVEPIFDPNGLLDEQYLCPICMAAHAVPEEAKQCCAGLQAFRCVECGHIMSTSEMDELTAVDAGSVFNWFVVTPWLVQKLKACGEYVIPRMNLWGRRRIAKDMWNDSAIEAICSELQILEGQKNDWSLRLASK